MMKRETSVSEGFNQFRGLVGLQFFSEEGGETGEGAADMDGFDGDAFAAGLLDGDLEDQQTTEQDQGEGADGDGENQPAAEQQEKPEEEKPDDKNKDGENHGLQEGQKEKVTATPVQMTFNGQQIALPGDAVQALSSALGIDPVQLLQKGMAYDGKAERELRMLDRFAAASGMPRSAYIEKIEQQMEAERINSEIEKARAEFPETPDGALRVIAESRVAAAKQAEMQRQQEQRNQIAQGNARVQQMVQQAREQEAQKHWETYLTKTGITKEADIPARVLEMVEKDGMTPMEAYYAHQAEQAQSKAAVAEKQAKNKQSSTGTMATHSNDDSDAFLSGLFGN